MCWLTSQRERRNKKYEWAWGRQERRLDVITSHWLIATQRGSALELALAPGVSLQYEVICSHLVQKMHVSKTPNLKTSVVDDALARQAHPHSLTGRTLLVDSSGGQVSHQSLPLHNRCAQERANKRKCCSCQEVVTSEQWLPASTDVYGSECLASPCAVPWPAVIVVDRATLTGTDLIKFSFLIATPKDCEGKRKSITAQLAVSNLISDLCLARFAFQSAFHLSMNDCFHLFHYSACIITYLANSASRAAGTLSLPH